LNSRTSTVLKSIGIIISRVNIIGNVPETIKQIQRNAAFTSVAFIPFLLNILKIHFIYHKNITFCEKWEK
jgi:hypothetical protein